LRRRRKGDPEKAKLARRLRAETTMTLARVAQHLAMGRRGCVAQLPKRKAQSANIKDTCTTVDYAGSAVPKFFAVRKSLRQIWNPVTGCRK
jgi:hypothetical protein